MSSKAEVKSKEIGKSLRARRKIDYKRMHFGKAAVESPSTSTEGDSDISLQGASGLGNPSTKTPPITPVIPQNWLEDEKSEEEVDYDQQMAQMSAEMESLDQIAQQLEKKERFEAMKRELAAKRQKVSELKGTVDKSKVDTKTHDKYKKITSKKNLDFKPSKIKKSKSEEVLSDDLDINSLRKDDKLKSLVRKELRKMGLADSDSSDNETDSTYSSSSSDEDSSDSNSNLKKKEKKKKKKKKNEVWY